MSGVEPSLWTIDELGSQVALSLAVDYPGQANGRVREVPDRRTIRYYTTLGLIDRPSLRGRTALYGRRHHLQLVAIKRLQAKGLSLAELQARLLGLPDAELERIAEIAPALEPSPAASPPPEEEPRAAFWKTAPAEVVPASSPAPDVVQGVRLAADVTLLINALRSLEAEEIEALRVAAAPLVKLLGKRRLISQG